MGHWATRGRRSQARSSSSSGWRWRRTSSRWAPFVVRELLFGLKRFTDLRAGLPLVRANVLSQRDSARESSDRSRSTSRRRQARSQLSSARLRPLG
jgi:DNA-binding HxlR family transcriptional regulator